MVHKSIILWVPPGCVPLSFDLSARPGGNYLPGMEKYRVSGSAVPVARIAPAVIVPADYKPGLYRFLPAFAFAKKPVLLPGLGK